MEHVSQVMARLLSRLRLPACAPEPAEGDSRQDALQRPVADTGAHEQERAAVALHLVLIPSL